jgi:glyoxylase-like metal-dependent hydrolase (beta-lactamase superfamily II)/8-oxo-dGTP pyrophosphatase MutT (NUDIX family)
VEAVQPLPAATVVLLRRGPPGLEVLLTRRPSSMAFAADMHVFPGGRVDPGDTERGPIDRSVVSPGDAAVALGGDLEPVVAIGLYIGAIRELFEEAGILLADSGAAAGPNLPARSVSLARTALVGGDASFAAVAADLDLRLRTDLLVPLSRWVTPPTMPRRFDTRFFVAELPPGARVTFEGDEVAGHAWWSPAAGLEAMAEGRLAMWLPTSTTLQQLEHVRSIEDVRSRLSPGRLAEVAVEELSPDVTRIVMPAGGGVAGQPVCAYLVGRRRFVLVDPGDPTGPALDRALEIAAQRDGTTEAVALTHVDPDHAAGAEAVAERLGIPVLVGPGGGRPLPYPVRELADLEPVPAGDVALRAVLTPGPRPDHVAYLAGDGAFALTGDLEGIRGARSIPGPADEAAWRSSLDRIAALAPAARRFAGHPDADAPAGGPAGDEPV